jgi:porin
MIPRKSPRFHLRVLAQWWQMQPDLQYIIAPGGGIPNPLAPASRVKNALIGGVRTVVTF